MPPPEEVTPSPTLTPAGGGGCLRPTPLAPCRPEGSWSYPFTAFCLLVTPDLAVCLSVSVQPLSFSVHVSCHRSVSHLFSLLVSNGFPLSQSVPRSHFSVQCCHFFSSLFLSIPFLGHSLDPFVCHDFCGLSALCPALRPPILLPIIPSNQAHWLASLLIWGV